MSDALLPGDSREFAWPSGTTADNKNCVCRSLGSQGSLGGLPLPPAGEAHTNIVGGRFATAADVILNQVKKQLLHLVAVAGIANSTILTI